MKIGILSDAHANIIGLNTCLDFLIKSGVKKVYYLGDFCGYFTDVNEVTDRLRTINAVCLMGNHDAMLLKQMETDSAKSDIYRIEQNRQSISELNLKFISSLPACYCEKIDGKDFLFVHGSPEEKLTGYVYPDTDTSGWEKYKADYIFMGHTHRAFIKKGEKITIVNVGSCSLPRDNGMLLSCCIYDSEKDKAELFRLRCDEEKVLGRYAGKVHETVITALYRRESSISGTIVENN